ncbi:MAG: fluoride efflux transporter CrcB [Deltaproteobacteria bacterium]|nr:MAG: fluoride efflux transporter CrcB [Deltaproteobacteria bacterium]
MPKMMWVGLGGAVGAMCRYVVSGLATRLAGATVFPAGTVTVNLLGCFLIGLLGSLIETRQLVSSPMRLLFMTGFLGGFTTFSTYGYESFGLLRTGEIPAMVMNIGIHTLAGLLTVWAGYALARLF